MTLNECLLRLEEKIKHLITPPTIERNSATGKLSKYDAHGHRMRKNFWCDSHPFLCFTCARFRTLLHLHACPKALTLTTAKGCFAWTKGENMLFHSDNTVANWDSLRGKYYAKQRVINPRLGHNLKMVEFHFYAFPRENEVLELVLKAHRTL
jgi:hypothetical protein